MREYVLAELSDHAFGRRREQVDLNEIHQALEREQRDQAERDPVEQTAIVLLKGGIEQMPDDLRKDQTDGGGDHETDRSDRKVSAERAKTRKETAERFWRAQAPRGCCGGSR